MTERETSDVMQGAARQAPMSPAEAKSRRARNVAIGFAVLAFCVLIYAITLAKLGSAVLKTS